MAEASLEGTAIGRYRVRRLLGAGGMGEVYLADDQSLGRPVALKVLPRELMRDPHRVQRFITEARAASALNHPAVVTIYEAGEDATSGDPVHFIAMEWVDGVTLDEWLMQRPELTTALEHLAAVADGLGQAHARGIIHRDLKPENIMITADGRAKVLDFGVARLVDVGLMAASAAVTTRTLTDTSALLGTVGYMSPEQIEGLPIDHRSDIFSLGCILYESVAGRTAFRGRTNAETLHNIVHLEPPPIDLAGKEAAGLQRILSRCLAKDREQRYDSARDLARDLLEIARLAPQRRAPIRSSRLVAKRILRTVAAAGAIVVALFMLGVSADAVVDTLTLAIAPSRNPEVRRLQEMLAAERAQFEKSAAAIAAREEEIRKRGAEIELLRAQRDQGERLRSELEASYRKLLTDVNTDLRRNSSERSELRARVASAETELQRFRDDQQRRASQRDRLLRIQEALASVMESRVEQRGLVLTLPGAYFGSGRSRMAPEAVGTIRMLADQLRANADVKITIEGHTDSYGDAEGNLELSEERALGVRGHLIIGGVEESRMTVIGRGESVPLYDNDSYMGRAANRRVEIILSF